MSAKTKYPDWFDYNRQPTFYKPKPTAVITKTAVLSSTTLDGKYDHIIYENDDIRIDADILGDEYDLQLEVRTYKKTSTPNEKYEIQLKEWEEERKETEARLLEWKNFRELKTRELAIEREYKEYLRLKKIFQPTEK